MKALAKLLLSLPLFTSALFPVSQAAAQEAATALPTRLRPSLAEATRHWAQSNTLPLERQSAALDEQNARMEKWLPSVNGNASAQLSHTTRWKDGKDLNPDSKPAPGLSTGVSLSWNLYNAGRDGLRVSTRESERLLKDHEDKTALLQLEAQFLADVLKLAQGHERWVRQQQEITLWQSLQKGIEAKVKGGVVARGALTEMEIEVSEQVNRAASLKKKVEADVASFNRRYGLREAALAPSLLPEIRSELASLLESGKRLAEESALAERASEKNPAIESTKIRISVLEMETRASHPRAFAPSLDLTASLGLSPEVHWPDAPHEDYSHATTWSVALGLTIPLFTPRDWNFEESQALKRSLAQRTLDSDQERRRDLVLSSQESFRILKSDREQKLSQLRARQAAVREREAFTGAGLSAVDELVRAQQAVQRAEDDLLENLHEQETLSLQSHLLATTGCEVRM